MFWTVSGALSSMLFGVEPVTNAVVVLPNSAESGLALFQVVLVPVRRSPSTQFWVEVSQLPLPSWPSGGFTSFESQMRSRAWVTPVPYPAHISAAAMAAERRAE